MKYALAILAVAAAIASPAAAKPIRGDLYTTGAACHLAYHLGFNVAETEARSPMASANDPFVPSDDGGVCIIIDVDIRPRRGGTWIGNQWSDDGILILGASAVPWPRKRRR